LTSNLLFMNVAADGAGGKGRGLLLTRAAYAALFLLGAVEGLIGSFQYSRAAPAGAIGFGVLLLATCLLGGWAMGSISGALAPAVGWIIASFVLSMPVSGGSVIISNTSAGKWYLYGGSACAVAAVLVFFIASIRRGAAGRR
jgi:Family of unknown function (DUF6113)